MRLRTKEGYSEAQVVAARRQMDQAAKRMDRVLTKVQEQVVEAKKELSSIRTEIRGGEPA